MGIYREKIVKHSIFFKQNTAMFPEAGIFFLMQKQFVAGMTGAVKG